jgi:hypothetical protein
MTTAQKSAHKRLLQILPSRVIGEPGQTHGEYLKLLCQLCGKEFKILASNARAGRGSFCSKKCSATNAARTFWARRK